MLCYNKPMSKVSLILPVYNKEKYLPRCLDSLQNQTDKSAQIIIVDDWSTDKSKSICKDYCKRNDWEYYRIKHAGVSVARNFGLEKVKSKYFTFLDADDALTEDAIDVMSRITRHGFNIYQFGQYRHHRNATYKDHFKKGFHELNNMPRRWAMVWNKLYKTSFVKSRSIKFIEGMQFGEDEMFNVRCALANGGIYHAPQTLIEHYFDDKESLCRGELNLAKLENLLEELSKLAKKQKDPSKRAWIENKIREHEGSVLYRRFGYVKRPKGKYDVVYFLKQSPKNEELRYSLRSLEKNWQYHKVWFYGGCPDGLKPDYHVPVRQIAPSKWQRVRDMIYQACLNDDLTEDFWLFNDDFFILKPKNENMPVQYNRTLEDRIRKIEKRHGGIPDEYTTRLRHLVKTLKTASKPTLDYAVHKPMLINRKRMLEVLRAFPDEPMVRALYGNYWELGGVSNHDMKIKVQNYAKMNEVMRSWDFLSTSDTSFATGNVGRYLRDKFSVKSKFEV